MAAVRGGRAHLPPPIFAALCDGTVVGAQVSEGDFCPVCACPVSVHCHPEAVEEGYVVGVPCLQCRAWAGAPSGLDTLNEALKRVMPGVAQNMFQNSPLLAYLKGERL